MWYGAVRVHLHLEKVVVKHGRGQHTVMSGTVVITCKGVSVYQKWEKGKGRRIEEKKEDEKINKIKNACFFLRLKNKAAWSLQWCDGSRVASSLRHSQPLLHSCLLHLK